MRSVKCHLKISHEMNISWGSIYNYQTIQFKRKMVHFWDVKKFTFHVTRKSTSSKCKAIHHILMPYTGEIPMFQYCPRKFYLGMGRFFSGIKSFPTQQKRRCKRHVTHVIDLVCGVAFLDHFNHAHITERRIYTCNLQAKLTFPQILPHARQ